MGKWKWVDGATFAQDSEAVCVSEKCVTLPPAPAPSVRLRSVVVGCLSQRAQPQNLKHWQIGSMGVACASFPL